MNKIIRINSLILFILFLISCDEINDIKELKNTQEGKDYFFEEQDRLNQLVINNPDSADIELTQLIKKYPKTANFLELRISLYISVKRFEKAKEDFEQLILLDPFYKESKTETLKYLDCKIITNGDCGDSLENVYTITISEDTNLNIESDTNVEGWMIDSNFLDGLQKK